MQSVPSFAPAAERSHAVPAWERILKRALSGLDSLAGVLDRFPLLCLGVLMLCTLPYVLLRAHATQLTGDEVYTYRIAQQPTVRSMISLSRFLDLHPPLHYLLERAALWLRLPVWLGARLPSLLATLVSITTLFFFVKTRFNALLALAATALFWFSPAIPFAWSNRPYALWICFVCLSAWLWQRAANSPAAVWKLALFCSITAMVMNSITGLACITAFAVAEIVRTGTSKFSPSMFAAVLLPSAIGVAYLHQVYSFANNSFAPVYLRFADIGIDMYTGLLLLPVGVLIACWAAAGLLTFHSGAVSTLEAQQQQMSSAECALGIALFLLPALFDLLAGLRHTQFFSRYGACGSVGMAIMVPFVLRTYADRPRLVATLIVIALPIYAMDLIASASFVVQGTWRAEVQGVPPLRLDALDPALPIVVANATTFTEMSQYEPRGFLAKTFYLYDRPSALQYSGSTIFETENETAALLHFDSRTAPLARFLAANRTFYMIATYNEPEEWLPRKLLSSGARLQYLGKFDSTYYDTDLYRVTLPMPAGAATPPPAEGIFAGSYPQH